MTDIFTEIDEELRKEQARKFWQRYGYAVIGGAVAIVLGTAAWQGYNIWQDRSARALGDRVFAALRTGETDKAAARTELEAIAREAPGGYQALLRFRAAAFAADSGAREDAVKAFEALSRDTTAPDYWRDLARVRAAYLMVDTEERAAFEARLSGLSDARSPWRHSARELRALAAYRANDLLATRTLLDEILADPETPREMIQRVELLLSVVRGQSAAQ
jgi:hypothetical protein